MAGSVASPRELDRVLSEAPSPFSDSVLTHAFRDPPDAPGIHGGIRRQLRDLIHHVGGSGESVVQVVTGDPGEGKTHLLSWLRKSSDDSLHAAGGQPFVLAPIEPIRSTDSIFHHVLHETVRHLSRPLPLVGHLDSAVASPLSFILLRALVRIARMVRAAPWVSPALADTLDSVLPDRPSLFLGAFAEVASVCWDQVERDFVAAAQRLEALGGIDRELFRVVAGFPHPDHRDDLVAWLGGASVSEEVATRLGSRIVLSGESEAWRGLQLLIHLAGLAEAPLVLAFDQIEGTERLGDEAVAAWLSALGEIYNAGGSTLLLVLCQTQIWPRLRAQTQQQVRDRLEALPPIPLLALRPEEAVALIELRMQRFWHGVGLVPEVPSYPFDRRELLQMVQANRLRTPRAVLRHMRRVLDERTGRAIPEAAATTAPPAEASAPRTEVRRRLAAIIDEEGRRRPRMPEVREQIVQGAMREALVAAWMSTRPVAGAKIESVDSPSGRSKAKNGTLVTFLRDGKRRRLYFETNNSAYGQSVAAAVKRLRDMLRDGQADRAMLLRETALPLPPTSRDLVHRLAPRGFVFWLEPAVVAPLAAFEQLLNAAAAGDVPVREDDVRRAAFDIDAVDSVVSRTVDAAFQDDRTASAAPHPWAEEVLSFLRDGRAMVPLPALVGSLDAPAERVHEAAEALVSQGMACMKLDRNRVPVLFLRPEPRAEQP